MFPVMQHLTRLRTELPELPDADVSTVALFRKRIIALHEAMAKCSKIPVARIERNDMGRAVNIESNMPDISHIEGVAMKFRFFVLQSEATYFEKVVNKIVRYSGDGAARRYVERIKRCYLESMNDCMISSDFGHPVKNKEIIDLWFNSEFFHSDESKGRKLRNLHEYCPERGSLFQLHIAMKRCSAQLFQFYYVVKDMGVDHKFIYSPDCEF